MAEKRKLKDLKNPVIKINGNSLGTKKAGRTAQNPIPSDICLARASLRGMSWLVEEVRRGHRRCMPAEWSCYNASQMRPEGRYGYEVRSLWGGYHNEMAYQTWHWIKLR